MQVTGRSLSVIPNISLELGNNQVQIYADEIVSTTRMECNLAVLILLYLILLLATSIYRKKNRML
jgi:hypothetical protein